MKSLIEKISDKLVNAFLKNKIIAPIPNKFTKNLKEAQKLRKLCESKIKLPIVGFKAAGTGIPLIKKFKENKHGHADWSLEKVHELQRNSAKHSLKRELTGLSLL